MFCKRNVNGSVLVRIHGEDIYEWSTAHVDLSPIGRSSRLEDIMSGIEDLLGAYPELANVKILRNRIVDDSEFEAYFHVRYGNAYIQMSCKEVDERSSMIHELQHAIQWIDGRCGGGNSIIGREYANTMVREANADMGPLAAEILSLSGKFNIGKDKNPVLKEKSERYKKLCKKVSDFSHYNAGFLCYKGNQGEIEARLSEQRSYLGAEELLSTPYVIDYDVKYFNTYDVVAARGNLN